MHEIEPYYLWLDEYDAASDKLSPFYGREYSEFQFSNKIYNYYIHPQWDFFGSSTLYCKILFADYETHFAIIELIGEWNDAVHNDIMEMKSGLINPLLRRGITKFILIGENILNFHASDELYYEEWFEEVEEEGGWIVLFNLREHIMDEMRAQKLHYFLNFGDQFNNIMWRKYKPNDLLTLSENLMMNFIG
jgi:hypothetical protein